MAQTPQIASPLLFNAAAAAAAMGQQQQRHSAGDGGAATAGGGWDKSATIREGGGSWRVFRLESVGWVNKNFEKFRISELKICFWY